MNDIKMGDWVYFCSETDGEKVFQCDGKLQGRIRYRDYLYALKCCHKLTQLRNTDGLKPGDRVCLIDNSGFFDNGEIFTVAGISSRSRHHLMINIGGAEWCCERFAKLPEVVTMEEVDQMLIDLSTNDPKPWHKPWHLDQLETPARCPRPEWLGIWDYCGDGYRITWEGPVRGFYVEQIHDGLSIAHSPGWPGPGEFWTMIEPAPMEARAHKPLQRPRKVDRIKTPVDTYDLG